MEDDPVLMPLRRPGILFAAPAWGCRLLAAALILGAAVAHVLYLTIDCPLDLAPDEAHYWDWSRHLDWSYYSKGPLVAWLIRASCGLLGDLSVRLSGNLMPAVRLPAVVCGALLLISVYILIVQTLRCERLALAGVATALTLPIISVGASLMTIDAPYTCCWGWALVFAHRAVFHNTRWAWLLTGLVVGIGILAKYTMVLFLPSLGLFLLTTQAYRGLLLRRGFWGACVLAAFCCLPILVWNAQHSWVTVRHVSALAGVGSSGSKEPSQFIWTGPLVLFGSQAALLLVFWFCCWLCAMFVHRPTVERDPDLRYLWWLSAPMFGVFLAFSIKTGGGEVNWPVTAYLSGLVLTGAWLVRQLQSPRSWYRRWSWGLLASGCIFGLLISLVVHRSNVLYPLLTKFTGEPTVVNPFPLRKLDPSCRLRGWRTLAAAIDAWRDRIRREDGIEPVLAGCNWTMPGELGVYCQGHPQAYSFGLATGDRHSQYDLWDNPIDNPRPFLGRTFLVVGVYDSDELRAAFDHVEMAGKVMNMSDGQPLGAWPLLVCRGYRGITPPDAARH
jgi:4-amino-4-deoxy-L-arabinose transferase-like glycosyltransferase